ncbi:MAG TPA: NAD-dependent epimerase/dehydratase family protein, partial [Vicinamibacterales bacterium]
MTGPPLVTGATGFAGSHLVDHLLTSEPAVAAWANPRGTPARHSHPKIAWNAVDLLDRAAVADAIATLQPSSV